MQGEKPELQPRYGLPVFLPIQQAAEPSVSLRESDAPVPDDSHTQIDYAETDPILQRFHQDRVLSDVRPNHHV